MTVTTLPGTLYLHCPKKNTEDIKKEDHERSRVAKLCVIAEQCALGRSELEL